jgi:hypothetical protein
LWTCLAHLESDIPFANLVGFPPSSVLEETTRALDLSEVFTIWLFFRQTQARVPGMQAAWLGAFWGVES